MAEYTADNLSLRVNGAEYGHVKLQYGIKDGFPSGGPELVIVDEIIGVVRLTDDCNIEMRDQPGADWKHVSLRYLVTLIETYRS